MSAAVLGGALFQLPLGRISDHYDRRLVLFFSSLVGAAMSLALALLAGLGNLLPVVAIGWGGMVMTMYAISLAHASDSAEAGEFVMVGSVILLIFGVSSAVGGPLAALFMAIIGPSGLFVFSAACLVGFALVISIRRKTHVLPVHDETDPFRPVSVTSPAVFEMDPRTGPVDETGAEHQSAWEQATSGEAESRHQQ